MSAPEEKSPLCIAILETKVEEAKTALKEAKQSLKNAKASLEHLKKSAAKKELVMVVWAIAPFSGMFVVRVATLDKWKEKKATVTFKGLVTLGLDSLLAHSATVVTQDPEYINGAIRHHGPFYGMDLRDELDASVGENAKVKSAKE